MRRADRLFQIIQILRRSAGPATAAALAAELEVSKRTVYRDIADLMAQRVPIAGEAGFGYILSADYDMPPLMLTQAELEAVVLGAQWVADRGDRLLSPAARDVIAKIAAAIPLHLRSFVGEPSTSTKPRVGAVAETVDTASLREAIRQRRKLLLVYEAGEGRRTERVVWPVTLGYSDSDRVLIAWCELRQDFRHFRTDRIRTAASLDQPIGEPRGTLLVRWHAARAAFTANADRILATDVPPKTATPRHKS